MKLMKVGTLSAALLLAACGSDDNGTETNNGTPVSRSVVETHFADLAHAMISDSLEAAESLLAAVNALTDGDATESELLSAQQAYEQLRLPYQQFEITRFDAENNHVTDAASGGPSEITSVDDWEGQVNAWPLDEALIDYVNAGSYTGNYVDNSESLNIINATPSTMVDGIDIGTSPITKEFLISLNEINGSEANVATGIHAIEFLLWGQDTSTGEGNLGAGERPASDFDTDECTNNNCVRRAEYLKVVTELLVDDLTAMEAQWDASTEGVTLRSDYLNRGDGLERILDSMGDMAIGELRSERMGVAVRFDSTEDEHDCFSDLTHIAIYGNALGVVNAYFGTYERLDGTYMTGPSLSDLVFQNDIQADLNLRSLLTTVQNEMQDIVNVANDGKTFDMLIGSDDESIVQEAMDALAALNEPFSEDIGNALNVAVAEIDQGTCPIGSVADDSCSAE